LRAAESRRAEYSDTHSRGQTESRGSCAATRVMRRRCYCCKTVAVVAVEYCRTRIGTHQCHHTVMAHKTMPQKRSALIDSAVNVTFTARVRRQTTFDGRVHLLD
jgi:hypothetical protein